VKVSELEQKAETAEQYSRRNCLRVSGIPETQSEVTDVKILDIIKGINVDLSFIDIDSSHRLGKPRSFASAAAGDRPARQKLYLNNTKLNASGHAGVYINEDLTRDRSSMFYHACSLLKTKNVTIVWTADGKILVRENDLTVRRINTTDSLDELKRCAAPQVARLNS
ncbi:hypothetical protein MAR_015369, partial [Mya arenaria]